MERYGISSKSKQISSKSKQAMNILFICSRNKWRSRTAESIFKNSNSHRVRSAGTEPSAQIRVNQKLLDWADLIFVMEKKHRIRIKEKFDIEHKKESIINLEIPDDYQYMDPELIEILEASVSSYFS